MWPGFGSSPQAGVSPQVTGRASCYHNLSSRRAWRHWRSKHLRQEPARSGRTVEQAKFVEELERKWGGPLPAPLLASLLREQQAPGPPPRDDAIVSSSGDDGCRSIARNVQAAAIALLQAPELLSKQQVHESVLYHLGGVDNPPIPPASCPQAAAAAAELPSSSGLGLPRGQQPRPAASVCVAVCTDKWACSSRGGWQVLAAFRTAAADVPAGAANVEVTPGMCLGLCKAAPNVRILANSRTTVHSSVLPGRAWDILRRTLDAQAG